MLFAVGSGGSPARHEGLLSFLASAGHTVVAPHFERLTSAHPSASDLKVRARRLSLALDEFAPFGLPVAGVGHSIGASVLLGLAGGHMWLGPDKRVAIIPDSRLARLVLLAPPTGFFMAPQALRSVRTPVLAWSGTKDALTPPDQVNLLRHAMNVDTPLEVRVTEGAGHFSFMSTPPPGSAEPLLDRQSFLDDLARGIQTFLT